MKLKYKSDKRQIKTETPQFTSMLLLLFIGLKLTGHITWSWWWVLSPFWVPLCLVTLVGFGLWVWYHTCNDQKEVI